MYTGVHRTAKSTILFYRHIYLYMFLCFSLFVVFFFCRLLCYFHLKQSSTLPPSPERGEAIASPSRCVHSSPSGRKMLSVWVFLVVVVMAQCGCVSAEQQGRDGRSEAAARGFRLFARYCLHLSGGFNNNPDGG